MKDYQVSFNTFVDDKNMKYSGLGIGLVLEGELSLMLNHEMSTIRPGALFILNHKALIECHNQSALTVMIEMEQSFIKKYVHDFNHFQYVLSGNTEAQDHLKNIIARMGINAIRHEQNEALMNDQLSLSLLQHSMQSFEKLKIQSINEGEARVEQIVQFIDSHYDEVLSLEILSDALNLSPTYISKLFSKSMDMGLHQYINHVRLQHAKEDLVNTDLSMTDIAMNNGFLNTSSFSRAFKQYEDCSPSSYRANYQQEIVPINKPHEVHDKYLIHLLSEYLSHEQSFLEPMNMDKRIHRMQLNAPIVQLHPFKHIVQIGDLKNVLIGSYQEQLLASKDEITLERILVTDIIGSQIITSDVQTDEKIPHSHKYYQVDACIDFLVKHQIGLTVTVKPTIAFEAYKSAFKDLYQHIAMRLMHGKDLNLKLYFKQIPPRQIEILLDIVHHYFKDLKIDVFVELDGARRTDFEALKAFEASIDLFVFDANQNDLVDFDSMSDAGFQKAKNLILNKTNDLIAQMKQSGIVKPLALLNWNTLTGNTMLTNGEYFRGGIIFEQFIQLNQMIDYIGYWLNYDLHMSQCVTNHDYLNSIELFHQYHGKRPAYFTSFLFQKLRGEILFQNKECLITGHADHFQVVVFDAVHYNPHLTLHEHLNRSVYHEAVIKDLLPSTYRVKHYTLDKEHGALYKVWQAFNTSQGIDRESIAYINRISYPKFEVEERIVTQDLNLQLMMQTNAIHLFDVKRMR